jgi:TonB family protein
MTNRICRLITATAVGLTMFGCSPKKPTTAVAAVMGRDTLTMTQVQALRPDSLPDSMRVTKVMAQRALARRCRTAIGGARRDTLLNGLMQQLSLRSGVEWNREATSALFDAACGLRAILDTAQSAEKVAQYLDSVLGTSTLANGKRPGAFVPCRRPGAGAAEVRFDSLLACVLGVSPEVGRTLEQFLLASASEKHDTTRAAAMVKGLLFDASRARGGAAPPVEANTDNSEAVLKFRNQASIQDTFTRHQANIRELYKKHLKLNARLAGKVVLQFRVAADGSVIDVTVAQTQVGDKPFIDGLVAYAKTVRFKPVPAQAGAMRFEFPFEFTPEE